MLRRLKKLINHLLEALKSIFPTFGFSNNTSPCIGQCFVVALENHSKVNSGMFLFSLSTFRLSIDYPLSNYFFPLFVFFLQHQNFFFFAQLNNSKIFYTFFSINLITSILCCSDSVLSPEMLKLFSAVNSLASLEMKKTTENKHAVVYYTVAHAMIKFSEHLNSWNTSFQLHPSSLAPETSGPCKM